MFERAWFGAETQNEMVVVLQLNQGYNKLLSVTIQTPRCGFLNWAPPCREKHGVEASGESDVHDRLSGSCGSGGSHRWWMRTDCNAICQGRLQRRRGARMGGYVPQVR